MVVATDATLDSLFWAGRYLERADGTARLLDLADQASDDVDDATLWRGVLDVLLLRPEYERRNGAVDPLSVGRFLMLDPTNPASVVSSVAAARDYLSPCGGAVAELANCVRTFDFELALAAGEDPRDACRLALTHGGAVSNALGRLAGNDDNTYALLTVGVMIERAITACRLADTAAFRHAQPRSATARRVLYCVDHAERAVTRLDRWSTDRGRARRLLARVRADLVHREHGSAAHTELELDLRAVADAVATQYRAAAPLLHQQHQQQQQ